MGGSLCARRATSEESKPFEPVPNKATTETVATTLTSEVPTLLMATTLTSEVPTLLMANSWSALLKEPPLNPDAKPFYPEGQRDSQDHGGPKTISLPPGLDPPVPEPPISKRLRKQEMTSTTVRTSVPGPRLSNQSMPPWRKMKESASPPKDGSHRSFSQSLSNAGVMPSSDAIGIASSAPAAADSASAGNMVFHAEDYLKLLKTGATKSGAKAMKRGNVMLSKSLGYQGLPGKKESSNVGLSAVVVPRMTASGLAKKWASAFRTKGESESDNSVKENTQARIVQDDIAIEKALVDRDLSDPAYWSETECIDRDRPSAHLLGRRPKMAQTAIRSYVMQDLSFQLDRMAAMLLLRLQRFMDQQRDFSQNNSVHRRLLFGLKEVARRTKQGRLQCLIVAPDIEENTDSGGLDDRMRELLASAYESNIPVIFALSRLRLGRALGKSLHISVIAILDATGAADLMSQAINMSRECRQAWLSRLPA